MRGRPQENFARELMELFTIGVGTFTENGRLRGRAGVHRLEPAAPAPGTQRVLRLQLQRRRSTTPTRRNSASRSTRTAARVIPARAPAAGHAGRHRSDQRASRAIPRPGPRLARKLYDVLRQRDRRARRRASSTRSRRSTTASDFEIEPMVRAAAAVAAVPATSATATSATRGRWSSWCGRSRKSATSASRSNDALTPLVNMGQQLFEPPDVNGWELGPRLVLDRRHAGADELRGAARDQPEVQLARRSPRADGKTPGGAAVVRRWSRLSPPEFAPASYARCSTTRAPAAPGPDRTTQLATKASGLVHLRRRVRRVSAGLR